MRSLALCACDSVRARSLICADADAAHSTINTRTVDRRQATPDSSMVILSAVPSPPASTGNRVPRHGEDGRDATLVWCA
jgi:hypothetical protein